MTVAIEILILFIIKFCAGSKHAFGNPNADIIVKLYERKLIDGSQNDVPKDYRIIYQFRGTIFQPILYIAIDVNKESTGHMKGSKGPQDLWESIYTTYSNYDATINIKNATHVTATLTIYTFNLPQYLKGLSRHSITFIHVKNTTSPSIEKLYPQNSIGKRHSDDELIYFESRNVTNINLFPSRVFEYSGSEYLTYVGFSFNSPTAVALINTTFVKEQEFNAIVYDMNTEHFVANISIYGIKAPTRPTNFLGLI